MCRPVLFEAGASIYVILNVPVWGGLGRIGVDIQLASRARIVKLHALTGLWHQHSAERYA